MAEITCSCRTELRRTPQTQSMRAELFPDFARKGDWPPFSPDLNPADYYVWGEMQRPIERLNPTTDAELKVGIRNAARELPLGTARKATDGFFRRCRLAVQWKGMPFKHKLRQKGLPSCPPRAGEGPNGNESPVANADIAQHSGPGGAIGRRADAESSDYLSRRIWIWIATRTPGRRIYTIYLEQNLSLSPVSYHR